MNTEKKDLIMQNIYLVKHFASKYHVDGFNINYDVLITSGLNGLLDAIESFNPKSGVKFSNIASNTIKFKILDEVKKQSSLSLEEVSQVCEYSLDYLATCRLSTEIDNDNYLNELTNINSSFKNKCLLVYSSYIKEYILGSSILSTNDMFKMFNLGLDTLSDLEKKVLHLYYTENLNYFQIKSILDISGDNIFFIHTLALAKLKEYIHSLLD